MTVLDGFGFTTPWLLWGLAALPILWLILRAVPPAPARRTFPAVSLLLGLKDDDRISDRTPWWLLFLRMLIVALMIIGLAGPVRNPQDDQAGSTGPLLILLDGSWSAAPYWTTVLDVLNRAIDQAGRTGRPIALVQLTVPEKPIFQTASMWRTRVGGFEPKPWFPDTTRIEAFMDDLEIEEFDTIWLSDGLTYDGHETLLTDLEERGQVHVFQMSRPIYALVPAQFDAGDIQLTVRRAFSRVEEHVNILAMGRDPSGTERVLDSLVATFSRDATETETEISLPAELRNRVTRFDIQEQTSAGAVTLADDSLRRREVLLVTGREDREGPELLSPIHYLERALSPTTELITGSLIEFLPSNPDVIVLADIATLTPNEEIALIEWVQNGGLLLWFAGPRLASSDIARAEEHSLMPVRLRVGGRNIGGAMSWGAPKTLAPFSKSSPFHRLVVPDDVTVKTQVLAQPDPDLAQRVIASLSDGTPLVTRKAVENGQVILFHVTANAEWSTLPLSGLFVEMLERLAVSSSVKTPDPVELAGTTWTPVQVMDGFGRLTDARNEVGIDGADMIAGSLGPDLMPGVYQSDGRRIARNVFGMADHLLPIDWPAHVVVEQSSLYSERPLGGMVLGMAIVLLLADVLATLALTGRIGTLRAINSIIALVVFMVIATVVPSDADDVDARAALATSDVVLAHVITGNPRVDEIAEAGLRGLSATLYQRTTVEPAGPVGVDLEGDELAFFSLLYWPISEDQPTPSIEAYSRLNTYLRLGGMIVFDTRDADTAALGIVGRNERKLQDIARSIDIPRLEPLPSDHVLTRSFYLLQDFPGRYASRKVWVEAAPSDAERIEGMPFRTLNDGVSPVVIGGNDWAAAWAINADGHPMLPVGRGLSGERQRELAYRFGVNLVMHVLTGNYKSDQVHVPALLERLGQ